MDLSHAEPGTASFYRSVLALPLLLPLAIAEARRERSITRRELAVAALAGVFFAADMLLWTQAIFDVGAGISMVLAGGAIDRPTAGAHAVRGTIESVLAALAYSGFLFILRRSERQTPVFQSYSLVIATSAIMSCAGGALWRGLTLSPPLGAVGWLALSAVCGQVFGWLLVATATPKLDSQTASVLLLLTPVGSLLLAAVILSQTPTVLQLLGSLLVLAGALTVASQRRSHGGGRGTRDGEAIKDPAIE